MQWSSRIVEVAGLSGVGKTTTCNTIEKTLGEKNKAWCPRIYLFFIRNYIDKLFLVGTTVRFFNVLKIVYQAQKENKTSLFLWIIRLLGKALCVQGTKVIELGNESVAIMLILNRITVIRCLAYIEAVMRNAVFIIDDGFMQRGTSVWLRTPPSSRNDILEVYYRSLPRKISGVIINGSVPLILQRAQTRSSGIRSVFGVQMTDSVDSTLEETYHDMSRIFDTFGHKNNFLFIDVNEGVTVQEQSEKVLSGVKSLYPNKKMICWACC
ncbi:MAG: hypothetical protein KKH94_08775 [Candidatus Omnitrophica bacterium]|nr:hypothetical protein [Candidatus Omnitrophota bacterium]